MFARMFALFLLGASVGETAMFGATLLQAHSLSCCCSSRAVSAAWDAALGYGLSESRDVTAGTRMDGEGREGG